LWYLNIVIARRSSMPSLFNVSVAASLALHAATILARGGPPLQAREISGTLGESEAHLSKVLRRMARAGLVSAKRGPGGGFELARPADTITLKEIYEAIEGPIDPLICPFGVRACNGGKCSVGGEFKEAGVKLVEFMAAARLSDYDGSFCTEVSENARRKFSRS
jgi:Rrf2 family protein